ncbi:hypothetical protein GCM10010399_03400 [Dactylosporangium fulvum]
MAANIVPETSSGLPVVDNTSSGAATRVIPSPSDETVVAVQKYANPVPSPREVVLAT